MVITAGHHHWIDCASWESFKDGCHVYCCWATTLNANPWWQAMPRKLFLQLLPPWKQVATCMCISGASSEEILHALHFVPNVRAFYIMACAHTALLAWIVSAWSTSPWHSFNFAYIMPIRQCRVTSDQYIKRDTYLKFWQCACYQASKLHLQWLVRQVVDLQSIVNYYYHYYSGS